MNLPWLNLLLCHIAPDESTAVTRGSNLDNMVPGVHRSRKLLFNLLDELRAKGLPAEQITFGGLFPRLPDGHRSRLHYPHRFWRHRRISG